MKQSTINNQQLTISAQSVELTYEINDVLRKHIPKGYTELETIICIFVRLNLWYSKETGKYGIGGTFQCTKCGDILIKSDM